MEHSLAEKFIKYLRIKLDNQHITYETPLTKIQGGFETSIYGFQLKGDRNAFADPLILRLYPEYYGSGNAVWESTVQNVLAEQGYPVAKSHLLCTDLPVLGGAFFVMDFLPGVPLMDAPVEDVPEFLGKTHAALHNLDPQPLLKSLAEAGIDINRLHIDTQFRWLKEKMKEFLWIRDAGEWLIDNVPDEPQQLAICHGDFHPLNILVDEDKVTGVLDWPGFTIVDPALDIAATVVLLTIPYKNMAPELRPDLAHVDFVRVAERYLDAYQAERSIDVSHLPYFRVRRCVHALIQGTEGQVSWQHPGIVQDLCDYICGVTGSLIHLP